MQAPEPFAVWFLLMWRVFNLFEKAAPREIGFEIVFPDQFIVESLAIVNWGVESSKEETPPNLCSLNLYNLKIILINLLS